VRGAAAGDGIGSVAWLISSEHLTAEMMEPGGREVRPCAIEVRFDPLTGHSSRILPDRGLMPPNDFVLEAFARENQQHCPFCGERINE